MRIFRTYALLVFLFAAALLNAALSATLEGTAYDPSGKAVAGARVTLTKALMVVAERQTDARGAFKFQDLQAGEYQVNANANGLSASSIGVSVTAQGAKKDIQMKLSAVSSQVVVSASLGGALAPEIGSSLSVIDMQAIETRDAKNALDAIRSIPGIEANENGHLGAKSEIYIRGGNHKDNAVMVNGIPINEFGGPFNYLSSLPSDGIDRIEMIRGPQSALYGSNAITGVINIITKRGEGSPRFTALAEGGSYSTRRFATGGNGLSRGFSWAYDLSRTDSEGVVKNDGYRNQGAYISLGYQAKRRQIDINLFGSASRNGTPGPYGSDPNGLFGGINTDERGKENMFGYQLVYAEQITSRWKQLTTASFSTNDLYYHSASWGDSTAENARGLINTRSEITISNQDTIVAGFEFSREKLRNTFVSDLNGTAFWMPRTSLAYFAENRWSPSSRFYLLAGVRIDDLETKAMPANYSHGMIPDNSIAKVNPRISASYLIKDDNAGEAFGATRLHGSFGTGIRPPDGFDLAFTNNPALKPERSISFDAGVEQKFFSSKAAADVTYFYNRFKDLIVSLGGTLKNLSAYQSDNIDNARAQGIELSFRLHPISSLEFGAEYTFLNAEILALNGSTLAKAPFQVGQELQRRPRHSGGYNVSWTHRRLTLSTNAYVRSSVLDMDPSWGLSACSYGMKCLFDNPGYIRMDAGFAYKLPHGVEIYGRGFNILNRKYEEAFGYPSLRANFMAGMRFSLPSE